jgi:hypothetical protein
MSSYPPPPYTLPPEYLPLPHGQLGPANPLPFPNAQQFYRGAGQFHPSWITDANASLRPVLKDLKPSPEPGPMRWPNQQFQPQKSVPTYAGPDQDLAGCGCSGNQSAYGAILGGASVGTKVALAAVLVVSVVSLLSEK